MNRFRRLSMYGVTGDSQIFHTIRLVCDVFGNGKNNNASEVIEKTIRSESHLGMYTDNSVEYGEGLSQFDKIAFDDTIKRTKNIDKEKCLKYFGLDLDNLKYEQLRTCHVLSIVLTRLKYKLIPGEFPTDDIGIYNYYKKHWNSESGKATIEHFKKLTENCYFN